MYSKPIALATLIQHVDTQSNVAPDARMVRDYIRKQKAEGRLIERRVFVDPARSLKRRRVFQFVAVNLEFDF